MAARTWSLNVLLLALVIAVAFGAWGGTSCVVLTNTDFPGNDIKCVDGLSNIYACADKCASTGGCLAFLWAGDDNINSGNGCCLKYAISQSNRNPDGRLTVITGYADCRAIFDPYQPGP